ncbi:MAG: WD40/YVTN/BNR-like repeat-containing protein [bacterium]
MAKQTAYIRKNAIQGKRIKLLNTPATGRKFKLNNPNNLVIVGSQTDEETYVSYDNGKQWESLGIDSFIRQRNFALSGNMKYWTYASGDIDGTYYVMHSSNRGRTYNQHVGTSCEYYANIHSSRDGKYMIVGAGNHGSDCGAIHVSQDFGQSWTEVGSGPDWHWNNCDISPWGKYMILNANGDDGYNKISYDYGTTFEDFEPEEGNVTRLKVLATSGDENYSVIQDDLGWIWVTTDWSTFDAHDISDRTCDVDISYDGKYIIVAAGDPFAPPAARLFVSQDYGQTFEENFDVPELHWRRAVNSDDGKFIFACSNDEYAYKSVDYGTTFQRINFYPDAGETSIRDCAMSKSGRHSFFTTSEGLYASHDYMNTWKRIFQGKNMQGLYINY